ncbi:MAG TPA: Asp-tRNA(Asn)/Glu-tRNA(Gln) amidotransferase subunit GatA [bacterium]|nr:Asp-tRNA(Asn)/Glu-tRNA(Gln) amidotransferase subunit GatA [bacterium]
MNLNELTILEARTLLDKGSITSVELTESCLARIKEIDKKIHACLSLARKEALTEAGLADKRLRAGERSPLLGIPYLVKDNILTKGLATTAASKMLENYIAPYDATIIAKLRAAGAVLLGKTNLDEFAHGASTEYSYFGETKNPYDLKRAPGGSSGGSAAAVAANMCLFALGTDTGGSIRHPASFCGVVGMKPSYGKLSRFGLISMTSSTDVPGVIAKTVSDAALVTELLAGADEQDATSTSEAFHQVKDWTQMTVGVVKDFQSSGADGVIIKKIEQTVHWLKEQGVKVIDINLPHAKYGVSVYCIITPAEISSNLARFDGLRFGFHDDKAENLAQEYLANRGGGFGDEVKRRIMLGTYILSAGYHDAYYLRAQKVRSRIIEDFTHAFNQVDLLLAPTTPSCAFKLGSQSGDPLKMYLEDYFLTPASLAGLPAVSVPAGLIGNLPFGLQIIGPKFGDLNVLALADACEQEFGRLAAPEL